MIFKMVPELSSSIWIIPALRLDGVKKTIGNVELAFAPASASVESHPNSYR